MGVMVRVHILYFWPCSIYTVDNYVLSTLWEQFEEEPRMCVTVGCPHTFGQTVYFVFCIELWSCFNRHPDFMRNIARC